MSQYNGLLEATFSDCLKVLNNLCEDFACFITTDFISTMSGFSKVLVD